MVSPPALPRTTSAVLPSSSRTAPNLILCDSSSYTPATDGDIVYTQGNDDIANDGFQVLHLDGVAVTTLAGDGRAAVFLQSPTAREGTTVQVRMTDGASVTTTADGHEGVLVHNQNQGGSGAKGGLAELVMEGSSSISTGGDSGAHGAWLERDAASNAGWNRGGVRVRLSDSASISTTGDGSDGIFAKGIHSEGKIEVFLKDSASVSTTGAGSHAVRLFREDHDHSRNNVEFTMSGDVTVSTQGNNSDGVHLLRKIRP